MDRVLIINIRDMWSRLTTEQRRATIIIEGIGYRIGRPIGWWYEDTGFTCFAVQAIVRTSLIGSLRVRYGSFSDGSLIPSRVTCYNDERIPLATPLTMIGCLILSPLAF